MQTLSKMLTSIYFSHYDAASDSLVLNVQLFSTGNCIEQQLSMISYAWFVPRPLFLPQSIHLNVINLRGCLVYLTGHTACYLSYE
jgi:hypothetical protein